MSSFKDLCRFCIKYTNSAVCLNHTDTDKVKFIDKLKFLFNDLILDEDNNTPFQICSTCCNKIKQTYDLKKQCTTSYEYWQLHFHISNISKTIKEEPAEELPTVVRKKVKTENQLVVDSLKNKDGSVLKANNNEPNPNILNLKNELSTLLEPEIEIKKENSDEIVAPIELNFTSLKSKLGNALKIGILNNEEEKKTRILKPITSGVKKRIICARDFICTICGFATITPNYLKRHIRKHSTKKTYECEICKKLLKNRSSFTIHMKRHGNSTKYVCHVCNKSFVIKAQYDAHFRIHSNEKPYLCTHCGKRFRKRDLCKRHVRIHTNEKPFACETCDKAFARKDHLVLHRKTHEKIKSFNCLYCGQFFFQDSKYQNHLVTCMST